MLTKIVDNGDMDRAILYEYNPSGELTSITYPSADTAYSNEGALMTQFVYGPNSRLEQVIDYTGMVFLPPTHIEPTKLPSVLSLYLVNAKTSR